MQSLAIRVGASTSGNCAWVSSDLLRLGLGYGTGNNSGNVREQTIQRPSFLAIQTYGYDDLNRLINVTKGSDYRNLGGGR